MEIISNIVKESTITVGDRNEVDDIMVPILLIQYVLGQHILHPKWACFSTIFKQLSYVCLIIYVIFGTNEFLKGVTDVASIGEAYFTYLVICTYFAKYSFFFSNRVTFQKVYWIAKTVLFNVIEEISVEKFTDMLRKMKLIVKMFFIITFPPLILYILQTIWANMHGERVTLSKTTATLMPMVTPYYEVAFVLHSLFLFHMSFSQIAIDLWFVIIMFFLCETCDCLVMQLQAPVKGVDESESEYATRLNSSLRTFHINHQKLMDYLNILSDMYKWPTIVPLINILLAICLLMLSIGEKVEWSFLSTTIPSIAEIFAYNWFGEQLKLKGTELNLALLHFDWTNMSLKDKKHYLIIVMYMNKEFSIKTALGNDLCLNTFTDVLKASYQAFTLLKTMED